jgi:FAD/FMN-containing dehydrogenase
MPDLMGLFINWQGMTGLVTKCAVQLWPKPKIQDCFLAIAFGLTDVAHILREVGRSETVNDISSVSCEVVKMTVKIPNPKLYAEEPPFVSILPVTADTPKLFEAKKEHLFNTIEKLNKEKGTKITLVKFDEFTKIFNLRTRCYYDLPGVILSLVEHSGLTWFGSYAPTHKFEELIEAVYPIFKKHDIPPFVYMKTMKYSHYGIFRPIIRYKKYKEETKVHAALEEITEACIEKGCIPYKTPIWMTEMMRKKINPGWLSLFEKVKTTMDPNRIFNPGRWNT